MHATIPQHKPNRCCACGRFVGDTFTGYERDRISDRGRLWCDRCAMEADTRERPSPEHGGVLPL